MRMPQILRLSAVGAAWGLLGGIVLATLGPQSLRPHLGDAQLERFAAYFLTASAFVLAYPRRPLVIALASATIAVVLEFGQFFAPGRDPGIADAIAKAFGGIAGTVMMAFAWRLWRHRRSKAPLAPR